MGNVTLGLLIALAVAVAVLVYIVIVRIHRFVFILRVWTAKAKEPMEKQRMMTLLNAVEKNREINEELEVELGNLKEEFLARLRRKEELEAESADILSAYSGLHKEIADKRIEINSLIQTRHLHEAKKREISMEISILNEEILHLVEEAGYTRTIRIARAEGYALDVPAAAEIVAASHDEVEELAPLLPAEAPVAVVENEIVLPPAPEQPPLSQDDIDALARAMGGRRSNRRVTAHAQPKKGNRQRPPRHHHDDDDDDE